MPSLPGGCGASSGRCGLAVAHSGGSQSSFCLLDTPTTWGWWKAGLDLLSGGGCGRDPSSGIRRQRSRHRREPKTRRQRESRADLEQRYAVSIFAVEIRRLDAKCKPRRPKSGVSGLILSSKSGPGGCGCVGNESVFCVAGRWLVAWSTVEIPPFSRGTTDTGVIRSTAGRSVSGALSRFRAYLVFSDAPDRLAIQPSTTAAFSAEVTSQPRPSVIAIS
jgi:hypothetical protein